MSMESYIHDWSDFWWTFQYICYWHRISLSKSNEIIIQIGLSKTLTKKRSPTISEAFLQRFRISIYLQTCFKLYIYIYKKITDLIMNAAATFLTFGHFKRATTVRRLPNKPMTIMIPVTMAAKVSSVGENLKQKIFKKHVFSLYQ